MKHFLVIASIFLFGISNAQTSKLTIVSLDSTIFKVAINGESIGDSSAFEFTDSLIISNKSILLDLVIPSFENYHLSSEIEIDASRHDIYNLQKLGDDFVLILFSSKAWMSAVNPIVSSDASLVLPDSIGMDSIQTIYALPEGCSLQSGPEHHRFMDELNDLDFEFQRVERISHLLKDICILSEQAKDIFETVEYEDKRLELILNFKDMIVDDKNINQLESLFLLTVNREAFIEAIN